MKTTVDTFNSDHGTVEGARSCRQCLYEQKEIEINCQIFDINIKQASIVIYRVSTTTKNLICRELLWSTFSELLKFVVGITIS